VVSITGRAGMRLERSDSYKVGGDYCFLAKQTP
jgi:hypothetical protein